jgi:hypothetical protein
MRPGAFSLPIRQIPSKSPRSLDRVAFSRAIADRLTLADLPASQNCHRSVVTASSGGLKEGKCEALSLARISGAAASRAERMLDPAAM